MTCDLNTKPKYLLSFVKVKSEICISKDDEIFFSNDEEYIVHELTVWDIGSVYTMK